MRYYRNIDLKSFIKWQLNIYFYFCVNSSGWIGTSHFASNAMDDWYWNLLFFQMMFAATVTIIVSGAMAERIHFVAYVVSAAMVSGLIYPVFGSGAWGSIFEGSVI